MSLANHWAALDIRYNQVSAGIDIVLTTDTPCHLWLRWSWETPGKHRVSTISRGLPVMGDIYLCFTVYNDIEQLEFGDTLSHRFPVYFFDPTTLERQTIYHYFWGTINGELSPSETCVFTYIYSRLYQYYHPAILAAWALWDNLKQSQSFIPVYEHEITKIYAYIAHRYDPCTILGYIYLAGENGCPSGLPIASGRFDITAYHHAWAFFEARVYLNTWPTLEPGKYVAAAYEEGDDTDQNFGRAQYLAQTFTLDHPFKLFRIKLKVWQPAEEGPVFLSIYNTDAAGKPTGTAIATTQNSGYWWDPYSPGSWFQFDFYFPPLLAGIKYAFVLSCPSAPASWRLNARKDAGDATYPGGNFLLSTDSGASWTPHPLDDLMFKMWGIVSDPATKKPQTHLIPGTEYCIVLTQDPATPAQTAWRGITVGDYPRGIHAEYSPALGWIPWPAQDLWFTEWGYPPLKE